MSLAEIRERDAEYVDPLPPSHRLATHTGGICLHDRRELLRLYDALAASNAALVGALKKANALIRRAANPPPHDSIGGIGPLKRDLHNHVIELDRLAALTSARQANKGKTV